MDPDGVCILSFFKKKTLPDTLRSCHSYESVVCSSLYCTGHALPNHSRAVAKYGLILW